MLLRAPPVPLTEMEVVIVVKAKTEVHPGVAEAWALIWADTVHAAVVLLVRAAAGDHASPPEVVEQGGPRRTVQPNLSFNALLLSYNRYSFEVKEKVVVVPRGAVGWVEMCRCCCPCCIMRNKSYESSPKSRQTQRRNQTATYTS